MGHHEHRKPITAKLVTAEETQRMVTDERSAKRNRDKYIRQVLEKEYLTNGNSFDKMIYTLVIYDIKALIKKELMPYVEKGTIKASVVKSIIDSVTKAAVDHNKEVILKEKTMEQQMGER